MSLLLYQVEHTVWIRYVVIRIVVIEREIKRSADACAHEQSSTLKSSLNVAQARQLYHVTTLHHPSNTSCPPPLLQR
jgi:hypothetical protein